MRPEDRDAAYLLDMLEAARKVVRYLTGKTRDDYFTDSLLRDAVERNVEIVGQAARRNSKGPTSKFPGGKLSPSGMC